MTASRSHHRHCRRDFLRVGALGGLSLSLPEYLRRAAGGGLSPQRRAESAIFIWLDGGPSHIDMFDLKPEAPAELRGEFRPIDTNVPGLQICEHLPKLAEVCDKFTLLRGVSHNLGDHARGTTYVNTGNRPAGQSDFPGLGALIVKSREARDPELPPFVAIPQTYQTGGYLGLSYGPLSTRSVPVAGRPFTVRGLSLEKGQTVEDFRRREALRRDLDRGISEIGSGDPLLGGLDDFSERAFRIISSSKTREALDISRESPSLARSFGRTGFGQSCLAAIRLVERGVRFVTVQSGGWDTHAGNFISLRRALLPNFDVGLAGFLRVMHERGLLDSTVVVVTGEFGRSPTLQGTDGRNHHPQAMFVLMAGGGIPGGRILGATDETAYAPRDFECSPGDVAASLLHSLGIDPQTEYLTNTGRPVRMIEEGRVIPGLFA